MALTAVLACLVFAGTAAAHLPSPVAPIVAAPDNPKRPAPTTAAAVRKPAERATPLATVSATGPGQAGYVHYFVITGPDGEPESQVGLELSGDRIAWSFPQLGVAVSPFMSAGVMLVNGQSYEVRHLYGLPPFRDADALRALQQALENRVAWWLNEKTPYCDEEHASSRLCVSCLGFALRVLYPGSSPLLPALPYDFKSARKNVYTTEDLLVYLAGVRIDVPLEARLKRISRLSVPENMREELVRIVASSPATRPQLAARPDSRPALAKARTVSRPIAQSPKRTAARKRS